MSLPVPPTSSSLADACMAFLRSLWSASPATNDWAFAYVLPQAEWYLRYGVLPGDPDPDPPRPPDDEGSRPAPPPDPPPLPAYPLGEMLGGLAALDAETMAEAWAVVIEGMA